MKKIYNYFRIKTSNLVYSFICFSMFLSITTLNAQCVQSFSDDFETGIFAAPWVTATGYTVAVNTTLPAEGLYSMNLSGSSSHYAGPKVIFTSATPNYITWRIKSDNISVAGAYVVIGDASISSNNGIVFAYITGGQLGFISSTNYYYPVVVNTWYTIELKNVNFTTKTFDIWINGVLLQTSFPFRSSASTSVNQLHVYNFNAGVVGSYDKIIIGSQSPSVTATPSSTTICSGTAVTLVGGGASTYTWSGGVTNGSPFSPTVTASYTVTGTAINGCTNTAVSNITVDPKPIVSVANGTICSGNSFTMLPTGASTYTFSGGFSTVSPTTTSTYSITGTSSLGCTSSNTAICSVTVNSTPTISATSGTICSGNTFSIVASGAATYTYTGGSGVVSPTVNTSYSVTGTSILGCVASNTAISSVIVNSIPTVSATADNSTICSGETVVLTATTSATSYTWNTGATTLSVSISPTVSATYTINVSDASTCVGASTVFVTVNSCTGINELTASLISIYPNPNNGIVNISLTAQLTKNSSLEVYDALGKLVVKQVLVNELNTINTSILENGIYTFKVLNNSSVIKIGKLIKQ